MSPRAEITFLCFLLAVWSGLCIHGALMALSGNRYGFGIVGLSVFFVALHWTDLWREYDKAKGKK